jgi:hypothetical protein
MEEEELLGMRKTERNFHWEQLMYFALLRFQESKGYKESNQSIAGTACST